MSGHRDPHDAGPSGRTEPTLGNLDHLDGTRTPASPRDDLPPMMVGDDYRRGAPPPKKPKRRGGSNWVAPLLIVLVVVIVGVLWMNENSLRGLVPRTDLNDVLHRAQTALQQGHLDGTDGTSARELFEAARALEPDNDGARDGLHQVGLAEVSRADASLRAGNIDDATQALTEARELLGGGSDVDRLTQEIAKARVSTGQTQDLVTQAQQALAAGKLDGPDGAGPLYQRLLAADPDNAVAQHGLDQVGAAMSAQIHHALDTNDRAGASAAIDRLATLLPNFAELPALRAALSQQTQQASSSVTDAVQQGSDALRAGRIDGPGDDTALAHFKAALALDPENAQAKVGLGQVAQAMIVQANAAVDSGDNGQAKQLLDQAAALTPKSPDLIAARARLGESAPADADAAGGTDATTPTVALSPQQQAQVLNMVQQAHRAAQQGNIMSPPGDCAYDLYRGALAIDGNNADALAGLQGLPALVRQQFQQALGNSNLPRATDALDALNNLTPGDASLQPLQQRLAEAWLDLAEQQFDSGDRNNAAQSLEHARKLAPNHPRVEQLSERMQGGA